MESHRRGSKDLRGATLGRVDLCLFNRQSRVGVGRRDRLGLAPMVSRAWPQPASSLSKKGSDARDRFSTLGCRINDYAGSCFWVDKDVPTRPILSRLGAGMVTYPCHSTHFSLFRCIVHAEMPRCCLFMIAEKEKSKGSDKSIDSPYARVRLSVAIDEYPSHEPYQILIHDPSVSTKVHPSLDRSPI